MTADLYIGTSGWHYNHWMGIFYPPEITGYHELQFHAQHFNTVENNCISVHNPQTLGLVTARLLL